MICHKKKNCALLPSHGQRKSIKKLSKLAIFHFYHQNLQICQLFYQLIVMFSESAFSYLYFDINLKCLALILFEICSVKDKQDNHIFFAPSDLSGAITHSIVSIFGYNFFWWWLRYHPNRKNRCTKCTRGGEGLFPWLPD